MLTSEGRFFSTANLNHCSILADIFEPSADISFVSLDLTGQRRVFSSIPTPGAAPYFHGAARAATGSLSVTSFAPDPVDLSILQAAQRAGDKPNNMQRWRTFRCRFDCGTEDVIALHTPEEPEATADYLRRLWPGLRRLCVQKYTNGLSDLSDDAMLWMISQKVNASILVMDDQCRLLKANAAGQELLDDGALLRDTPRGLVCTDGQETRVMRAAVAESFAQETPNEQEYLLILRGRSRGQHVPMSLSAYVQIETGARLVMAMLPMPPDHDRIEEMARHMGLSPAEARVAALIREGHSNRKAAEIAGIKIETFNTYAKRALSKMNVTCRADMAQMLTWQASLERSQ